MKAFFKYWGGKFYLREWVLEHFPKGYENMCYVEPFCGSLNVLFAKRRSKFEVANDLDRNVFLIYKALRERPTKLLNMLNYTAFNAHELKYAHQILNGKIKKRDWIFYAWAKYVSLNMSYFGMGQKTDTLHISHERCHAIPFTNRFKESNYNQVLKRLKLVEFANMDALKLIKMVDSKNTLFYLDPPYPETHCSPYKDDFKMQDFNKLTNYLKTIKGKYIISFELKPGMECNDLQGRYLYKKTIIRDCSSAKNVSQKISTECLLTNFETVKPKQLSLF